MKKKVLTLVLLASLLCFIFPMGIFAEELEDEVLVNDELDKKITSVEDVSLTDVTKNLKQQLVVVYKNNHENNIKTLSLNKTEIDSAQKVSNRVDVLEVNSDVDIEAYMEALRKDPNVLAVDKNEEIKTASLPNDPYIKNGEAWQFQKIGAEKTWDRISNTHPVVVAVIDTGINTSHEDLQGKISRGYDYVNKTEIITDQGGHGTPVSGCIVATANNGIGSSGIAGTANIQVAPYMVGDDDLNLSYIIAAIMDAADRPEVKVINMSYGDYLANRSEKAAIDYAAARGKLLIAAAGNEGNEKEQGQYSYPASYANVISVGATDSSDEIGKFSQYNDKVDLCAPGEDVVSTQSSGDYAQETGTSFSAPIVSGAAAVLFASDAAITATEVRSALITTAKDLGTAGRDPYYGEGLIRLDQALEKIANVTPPPSDGLIPSYRTHVSDFGWQGWVRDGALSGTVRQAKRLEGINIKLENSTDDVGIQYQTHIENIGWQEFKKDGEMSGTEGKALRLEAIRIELTKSDAKKYDVYYQVHAENFGWLDWAKNGDSAGTAALALRLEAIRVKVLPKGSPAPGSTARPFVTK